MVKTFLFIPTTFLALWLAGVPEFNLSLTTADEPEAEILIAPDSDFKSEYKVKTIVIDAGHGGKDGGCSGANNSLEKKLNLQIAKKVKSMIEHRLPGMQIIMTREKDVFIPLHKRAKIANENGADLFLSIHCNAIRNAGHIHGSESYVLGLHKAERNLEVVKRENDVIFMEKNYEKNYGFDPNSPAGHIMMSAFQNAHLEQSILFAKKIEERIKIQTPHKSRGVKQAGFFVLRETTMPSVLLETGYLTSEKDEKFLESEKGQTQIAEAIVDALSDYKEQVESGIAESKPAGQFVSSVSKEKTVLKSPKPEADKIVHTKPLVVKNSSKTAPPVEPTAPKIKVVEETPVAESSEVIYKIQIAASRVRINMNERKLENNDFRLSVREEGRYLKYQLGGYAGFGEAVRNLKRAKRLGYSDAFIVAYDRGEKISLQKAKSLTE